MGHTAEIPLHARFKPPVDLGNFAHNIVYLISLRAVSRCMSAANGLIYKTTLVDYVGHV